MPTSFLTLATSLATCLERPNIPITATIGSTILPITKPSIACLVLPISGESVSGSYFKPATYLLVKASPNKSLILVKEPASGFSEYSRIACLVKSSPKLSARSASRLSATSQTAKSAIAPDVPAPNTEVATLEESLVPICKALVALNIGRNPVRNCDVVLAN